MTMKSPRAAAAFSVDDLVVYPTHGVGQVTAIENQVLGGQPVSLIVITFERERMTLRVPMTKAKALGLRRVSTRAVMAAALTTLRGRRTTKRAMWSRRAIEYTAKINSGNPVSIAEVVRDLHRGPTQAEQSYSERQLYEQACGRLTTELAAVEKIPHEAAVSRFEDLLNAA